MVKNLYIKKIQYQKKLNQFIVDEYHRLVKLESEPELETKKIRISFLKKKKTH